MVNVYFVVSTLHSSLILARIIKSEGILTTSQRLTFYKAQAKRVQSGGKQLRMNHTPSLGEAVV